MMIVMTTIVHGCFAAAGVAALQRQYARRRRRITSIRATVVLAVFVLWLFLASIVEIWIWAGLYRHLGVIESLEEALYFSTVTFTTLGYGDVVLAAPWRLVASFEAANGLFLFGWSTALVFAVAQRFYFHDHAKRGPPPSA